MSGEDRTMTALVLSCLLQPPPARDFAALTLGEAVALQGKTVRLRVVITEADDEIGESEGPEDDLRVVVFRKGETPQEGRLVLEGLLRLVRYEAYEINGVTVPAFYQYRLEDARR